MAEATCFPLSWPQGWKRTRPQARVFARFSKKERVTTSTGGYNRTKDLSIHDGVQRIIDSLERMSIGSDDVVISTDVRTRLDGMPRSGEKAPEDPGAAVYWRDSHGAPMKCMAVDRYTTVEGNLAAIAATLEAMRAIERHGGAEILNRTFAGFAALPQNAGDGTPWRDMLEVGAGKVTVEEVEFNFKTLAKEAHPDKPGGDAAKMAQLNLAREEALRELRGL